MPRTFPRSRLDLTVVYLDDECVVYDEESGDLHHLNPTATVVLDLCDGSSTISELSSMVAAACDRPVADVEPGIRAAIRGFRRARLLDPPSASRRRAGR